MGRRRQGNGAAAAGGSGDQATPGQVAGAASDLSFGGAERQASPAARRQVNAPSLAPGSGAKTVTGSQS